MAAVSGREFVVTRGEDVWIYDEAGRRYFDATASLWYANIGHGRPEIREAVTRQMKALETYTIFNDVANPPAMELADRLSALAPMHNAAVFFGSGGADAIDTAAKLARRYWSLVGADDRVHLISRTGGYHGTHGYGTSLAGIPANREGWGPLHPHVSVIPFDSVEALRRELDLIGATRVAAFVVEPIIGAGGVHLPPEGYLEQVADICRKAGVLLVVDAVICGFGRLGTWFGIERWDVSPDMITFAKGVTSGYLPLGGVLVDEHVAAPFWDEAGATVLRHGPTYAGHATCCAAALANLDILEDGLLERGRVLEVPLADALDEVAQHDAVAHARAGTGFLGALELDPEVLAADAGFVMRVAQSVRAHGALVRPLGSSIAVSPPLTATKQHLELLVEALNSGLDDALSTVRATDRVRVSGSTAAPRR
jgi:adenosylmethionine-8-amino-7-oxononanoate aminotransferase